MRRQSILASAIAGAMFLSCTSPQVWASQKTTRVLFVGNSLTYTNNLPAFVAELLAANETDTRFEVDMLVEGGAQVDDWATDERLDGVMRRSRYDIVVLQEQGGRASCAAEIETRSTSSCVAVIDGHRSVGKLARLYGARLLYLGTYQPHPRFSRELVKAEAWIASDTGADPIEISETLNRLLVQLPTAKWFDSDGMHPGPMLTALMAVRVFKTIEKKDPVSTPICIRAPMYRPTDKFVDVVEYRPGIGIDGLLCAISADELGALIDLENE